MKTQDLAFISRILSKNHIPDTAAIKQFNSGQINSVYDIDNKYVIKLEGDLNYAKGIYSYQPALNDSLLRRGAKVPKILDYGNIDGKEYLLMEEVKGQILAQHWPYETDKGKKEYFIEQIAQQLKIYHSLHFDHYAVQLRRDTNQTNWLDAVDKETDFSVIKKSQLKFEYKIDVELLEDFYAKNKALLNEQNTAVFTHNDMHFENILFEGDSITGVIDFDWCSYAPKDYELRKFADFAYMPDDYIGEESLWPLYENVKLVDELRWLKKYYPELFDVPNLYEKIKLYFISHLLHTIMDYQQGRWSEQAMMRAHQRIKDIFKNDWFERSFT